MIDPATIVAGRTDLLAQVLAEFDRAASRLDHMPFAAAESHARRSVRQLAEHLRTVTTATRAAVGQPSANVGPAPARTPCCDVHGIACEPPAELCCIACPEIRHPIHPPGVTCVLVAPPLDPAGAHALREAANAWEQLGGGERPSEMAAWLRERAGQLEGGQA